jgi:hypothetical protein
VDSIFSAFSDSNDCRHASSAFAVNGISVSPEGIDCGLGRHKTYLDCGRHHFYLGRNSWDPKVRMGTTLKSTVITLIAALALLSNNAYPGIFGYDTEEECRNKELQKYGNATQSAERTVVAFCAEKFAEQNRKAEERLANRVEKKCKFDYRGARKAGYSRDEILDHLSKEQPGCWH